MKTIFAFFAARRYWKDEDKLQAAYKEISALAGENEHCLVTEADDPLTLPPADCLVAVPMSGAVQKNVLAAAKKYTYAVLYGAYIRGNASPKICEEMLRCNAAPTLMDTWGVLHRGSANIMLALNETQLKNKLQVLQAATHVRRARLLKIGETEPWVVSNAEETAMYTAQLGVEILPVPQAELAKAYENTTREEAEPYYELFTGHSTGCKEPTEDDLWNAARMAAALMGLLKKYEADGCAIACFNLLQTGTTACLGLSYINDCTGMVAACEGDLDSAVTMLLMKKLTDTRLWMANPGLHPDGSINFSHCTGPVCCLGEPLPYVLRNHHESGIGVSLQIEMPVGQTVTACRVSDNVRSMTIHKGVTVTGPYEPACRTQMHVRLDDTAHYLATALGCHQVFAYEDICEKLRNLAAVLGLQVL
ncbi:MAG: hypothetical protein IKU17_03690 [Clostridia bacterium]|nr:hypothetical protein [Clostridia bacterium]